MIENNNNNTMRLGLMFAAGVLLPLVMASTGAEEIRVKSVSPARIVSTPAPAQDTPAVAKTDATRDEIPQEVSDVTKVQSTFAPAALIALGVSAQPAYEILAPVSAAYTGMRLDEYKPGFSKSMTALPDHAADAQLRQLDRQADPEGLVYAIAMGIFALLGMVSVARRDTPPSLTSESQRTGAVRKQLNLKDDVPSRLARVVGRVRRLMGTNIRVIRNVK